ncbi:unnamed protein product [Hymenolepis diminuta]|uniref:60S ribosomal protein L18a n=1 Tax=Hymenolepis diminuta TaxID=6216 RepID=A0A0R3SPF7_HYMDI|nr:unnamed protein product [Hymenolepis diminuta]VUZ42645.1 unnamed protein product [Hymenolepis diminuta]
MRASGKLKLYVVVGRKNPTEKEPKPVPYRMRIFAPDLVTAKSRFWYFIRQLKKMKKGSGEIVSCKRLHPKKPLVVRNYGIWIRYDSRSGTHNMYKEYRDLTEEGAVTQLYREMGARHRARATSIQVIKVEVIPDGKCRRPHITQFHDKNLKFPLPHRVNRQLHTPRFTTARPLTTF